jgi:hypothetical protein
MHKHVGVAIVSRPSWSLELLILLLFTIPGSEQARGKSVKFDVVCRDSETPVQGRTVTKRQASLHFSGAATRIAFRGATWLAFNRGPCWLSLSPVH